MVEKNTILIVDDEQLNIDMLIEELGKTYTIVVAKNGRQALKRVCQSPIDVILLDILMPDMDGYEVCRCLKENPETRNIPVIFITSKNEDEDEAKGLLLGAVDYIKKPFYLPIVKTRIKTHLELKTKTEMLERLATLDGLTQISNRREFDNTLNKEFTRAIRSNSSLSLLMVDIDYFKNYNDNYGHVAGDECLRRIADALKQNLRRTSDFLFRYGGEEFAVILPCIDSNGAMEIAEYLRLKIESLKIPHEYSAVTPYTTISIGVASIVPAIANQTMIELIVSADEALYEAKRTGRNRVCIQTGSEG